MFCAFMPVYTIKYRMRNEKYINVCIVLIDELTLFKALSRPVVSPPISRVILFILLPAMILTSFQGMKKASPKRCNKI